ncbi:MAG: response regulator [Microcoleaceae cyanobacterium]
MQTEQIQKIMGYFIEEARDHLNTIEQGLLNLQDTIEDPELLSEIFRAAHSVKGGAAMLGINSVRNLAHRLEDSFKILKENSIKVDDKLESLFLRVFDTLKDLLEQLSSNGLTESEETSKLKALEPVFEDLEQHLEDLAEESKGFILPKQSEISEKQRFFGLEVPEKMREMLLTFKQPDDAKSRTKLRDICDILAAKGREFNISNWLKLIDVVKQAIANTKNTYDTLAHHVIKNLKQAQELIIDNREQAIVIDDNLKALVHNLPKPENQQTISEKNIMLEEKKSQQNNIQTSQEIIDDRETTAVKDGDSIDDWFHSLETTQPESNDNLVSEKLEVEKGPEVGAAELNSLADLFEGDTPNLDASWEEEEILDRGKGELNNFELPNIDSDSDNNSGDLSDLLFDVEEGENLPQVKDINELNFVTPVDDLSDLFNDTEEIEIRENISTKHHLTSSLEYHRKEKSTDDLASLFSDLSKGDLAELEDVYDSDTDWQLETELETTTAPEKTESIPQNQIDRTEKSQVDDEDEDEDFSDLLAIKGSDRPISKSHLEAADKLFPKQEKTQPKSDAKNDLTLEAADLEALFEDVETDVKIVNDELQNIEDVQVESEALIGSFAELFEQGDLESSESEELANVSNLEWQDVSEDNSQDLNNLFEEQSIDLQDLANLDTSESLEVNIAKITTGNNTNTQKNQELSADLEELWLTTEVAETSNDLNEITDLDELLDLVSDNVAPEPETTTNVINERQQVPENYEFIALEAILNGEKAENYNPFVQLEQLLNGTEIQPKQKSNTAVVEKTTTKKATTTNQSQSPKVDPFSDLDKLLEITTGRDSSSSISKSNVVTNTSTPRRNRRPPEQTVKVPAKQLDNLSNLIGELVVNRNSLEQGQERMRQFLDNLLHQVMLLSDVGQRMHDLYEKTLLERAIWDSRHGNHSSNSSNLTDGVSNNTPKGKLIDSLDLDRPENFSPFHLLAQETIEYIVRVRESTSDIEFLVDDAEQVTRQLRQVTTQLQEGITRSRMIPFSQTVQLLPRAVRDISMECGKEAELVVEGKDALIDKMIQDKLSDPMKHLLNNAITHGIETPQERRAVGKSPKGRITIRAFHQGNQTVISVADNGAGIDPEKVRNKAIEKNVITQQKAQEMSNLDLYDLLFHPGFSTKDKADNFSGRGVGLDVVKTNLSEIRGTITIDSTIGKGTVFTIRLPLTLSISKALCCISDRSWIAFPMDGVEDMVKVSKDEVKIGEDEQSYIEWRGKKLPFRHLRELLVYNRHLGRGNVYGINSDEDMISIVVLRSVSADIFLAVQVDQVLEQQKEIVIKQLEGPVPKPLGIAGATVLGDGKIVAIADVIELINLATGKLRQDDGSIWPGNGKNGQLSEEEVIEKSQPTVLIVDDSITVRELLSITFSKSGYRVEQARDGKDAWEKLRAGLPCDLVFCDIEMPRMDGFELLSRMQKDPSLSELPVAMLTSRGARKHMEMAFEYGAKGYFTKPYIEEKLLEGAISILEGQIVGDVVNA